MAVKKQENIVEKKDSKKEYIFAVGRRRAAIARVRLYAKAESVAWADQTVKLGEIFVNGKKIEEYFSGDVTKVKYLKPFEITNTLNKFITTIVVEGGGKNGQLDAAVLGISRALSTHDKEFRPKLKVKGLLTRDSRARERRKVGTGGKARRTKQSPKR